MATLIYKEIYQMISIEDYSFMWLSATLFTWLYIKEERKRNVPLGE